jgi:hypothetical protein
MYFIPVHESAVVSGGDRRPEEYLPHFLRSVVAINSGVVLELSSVIAHDTVGDSVGVEWILDEIHFCYFLRFSACLIPVRPACIRLDVAAR